MHATERTEARILDVNNVLVAPPGLEAEGVNGDFFGSAITTDDLSSGSPGLVGKTVYLCGDVPGVRGHNLGAAERVFVIREFSPGYSGGDGGRSWALVDLGRVPVRVHGVGVYYRRFFGPGSDYFNRICAEHAFQSLTESTKPGTAHRTGIYLTPVTQDGDGLHFRLLRCSTNLAGPTETSAPPTRASSMP